MKREGRGERREAGVIEVEVQLTLAEQLGYVQSPVIASALEHCDAISRMITNLKRAL